MPIPRVFVSSTCYDLADERDGLSAFCSDFGFDVALSERGDVFYHPDLHTHVSCTREVSTCQLFVLVIGGRFGGKYVADKTKSITNAEYASARELGIPIFTFVKQDVLNDHNLWQKNKDQPFASQITYPSIDKQEHAQEIFSFIDQVRLAPTNNGFFGFRLSKEIFGYLRKQWASMFFEYLQNRALSRQLSATNETLASLTAASDKIEEIVRNIYRNVDATGAADSLAKIDLDSRAREMFLTIAAKADDRQFLSKHSSKYIESPPSEWYEFLVDAGYFELENTTEDVGSPTIVLRSILGEKVIAKITGERNKLEEAEIAYFREGYRAFLDLSVDSRKQLVRDYTFVPAEEAS
ncbi:DUF4062 domain-containing protein [Paraburkholderia youngii]|uniref:DUF4062 domain-containing protein n=1 Tax=Paraburkholderia youngii TaxID=2782701 RepID=UPI003D1E9BFD